MASGVLLAVAQLFKPFQVDKRVRESDGAHELQRRRDTLKADHLNKRLGGANGVEASGRIVRGELNRGVLPCPPVQQRGQQSGFARARRAGDQNHLASLDVGGELADNFLIQEIGRDSECLLNQVRLLCAAGVGP